MGRRWGWGEALRKPGPEKRNHKIIVKFAVKWKIRGTKVLIDTRARVPRGCSEKLRAVFRKSWERS